MVVSNELKAKVKKIAKDLEDNFRYFMDLDSATTVTPNSHPLDKILLIKLGICIDTYAELLTNLETVINKPRNSEN